MGETSDAGLVEDAVPRDPPLASNRVDIGERRSRLGWVYNGSFTNIETSVFEEGLNRAMSEIRDLSMAGDGVFGSGIRGGEEGGGE